MDEALCVHSPGYPDPYEGGGCTIGIMKNSTVLLDVIDFDTQPLLDVVTVIAGKSSAVPAMSAHAHMNLKVLLFPSKRVEAVYCLPKTTHH